MFNSPFVIHGQDNKFLYNKAHIQIYLMNVCVCVCVYLKQIKV